MASAVTTNGRGVITTDDLPLAADFFACYPGFTTHRETLTVPPPLAHQTLPKKITERVGTYTFPVHGVGVFDKVELSGPVGVCFARDGRVILEPSYAGRFDVLDRNRSYLEWAARAIASWERPVLEIGWAMPTGGVWSENYFHWVAELLPRLYGYHRVSEILDVSPMILTVRSPQPFVRESLITMGIPASRIMEASPRMRIRHCVVPTCPRQEGGMSPSRATWLCAQVWDAVPNLSWSPKRIYISREDSLERRIVNEDKLVYKLETIGYELYTLTGMKFEDQVRLFYGATNIIGLHGAGMANMMWADSPCDILEISTEWYVNPCLMTLSAALGHNHAIFIGKDRGKDTKVDIDKLMRLLEAQDAQRGIQTPA